MKSEDGKFLIQWQKSIRHTLLSATTSWEDV